MTKSPPEVFTIDELSRAAGVSRQVAEALVEAGEIPFIPGTPFVTRADAIAVAPRLLKTARELAPLLSESPLLATERMDTALRDRKRGPAFASSLAHFALVALILWATARPTETSSEEVPAENVRLVFLITPGPGGGGGGGGERSQPAPRLRKQGAQLDRLAAPSVTRDPVLVARRVDEPLPATRVVLPRPEPLKREPDPLPSNRLIAPVAVAAASARDREGVIENARTDANSRGEGAGGGTGSGQGFGNGEGLGSGIGQGAGGGTGGGPYRAGSGIEPPRLVSEVKADYTDDARRRGITGDVILEIVVRRDGSVGDISLLRGIGGGLDQRAIAAVRQWRFRPAQRKGELVDVIVEVAVEFTLR